MILLFWRLNYYLNLSKQLSSCTEQKGVFMVTMHSSHIKVNNANSLDKECLVVQCELSCLECQTEIAATVRKTPMFSNAELCPRN